MCGIAGIAGSLDQEDASVRLRKMSNRMAHRGPDAEGYFAERGIALGHRRLSIIDLSEKANQPLFDSTERFSIILNGEIYNYKEIKASLPDYPFVTDSDTEAIVAAYATHGPACLSMINGMFAFAIWDRENAELFVARDRLGVKPLYYTLTDDGVFIFASEIRAILESGLVQRKLSETGLYDYLMYQSTYAPATIVDGIFQLKAGEYCVFAKGELSFTSYWKIEETDTDRCVDQLPEVHKNVRELLTRSIEMRLVSDVRLGAFLSGGIDSSAVVGLMSEVCDEPVETFSVNFAEKDFDESAYSDLVAKRFRTRHTKVFLSSNDFLDELPNALTSTDSPSGDGINTYIVSKATKKAGIKVALSGLGGDELFAGYPNFLRWAKTKQGVLPKVPASLRQYAATALAVSSNSRRRRMADLLSAPNFDLHEIYPLFRQVLSETNVVEYLGKKQVTVLRDTLEEKASAIGDYPLLSQFSIAEIVGYTQNVLLKDTDQYSMASALEVREPFFDYKLIEYVLRIPDELKYPKYPKSLLVESLSPLLPQEIVHRRKMGFVLPWDQWMRSELRDYCAVRIERLAARGIVNSERLRTNWKNFLSGSGGVTWSQMWHLVVLSEWLDTNRF